MKKKLLNLRGITEILSEKELKMVKGGNGLTCCCGRRPCGLPIVDEEDTSMVNPEPLDLCDDGLQPTWTYGEC